MIFRIVPNPSRPTCRLIIFAWVASGLAAVSMPAASGQIVVGSDGADATDATAYTGAQALEKIGTNTVSLTGNSSYTDGTTITSGTLSIGDGGTTGSITGNAVVSGGASLTFNRGDAIVFSGTITGAGSVAKLGAGNLTLSSGSNTYVGGTVIHSGTLTLGGPNNGTSKVGSGTLTANAGTTIRSSANNPLGYDTSLVTPDVVLNGAVWEYGGLFGSFRNLKLNSGTISRTSSFWYKNQPGTISATGSSAITGGIYYLRPAAAATMPFDVAAGGVLTVSSTLRNDSGASGLAKTGAGTLVLSASNNYTGDTQVRAGTLQLPNVDALSRSTLDLRAADTGVLDFAVVGPQTYTFGGLSGSRNLDNAGNSLAIGANNASTTYSGAMSGAGGLSKAGAGTLSLTGANTYTGPTTVLAGVLSIGAGGSTGSVPGDVQVNSGATLTFNRADNVTFSDIISGSGAVTKAGAGTLTLTGPNTYSGATSVTAGKLVVNGQMGTSGVSLAAGTSLGGAGSIPGAISGAGSVAPGNSPGILTAAAVDPSGGLDFTFEFSGTTPDYSDASASFNDVLRLTGNTPFTSPLTAANSKTLFLNFTKEQLTLGTGSITTLAGGFFTDVASDFTSSLYNATWNNGGFTAYVLGDGLGTDNFLNGVGYYNWRNPDMFGWTQSLFLSTTPQTATFDSGSVNGQVMLLTVAVPEPSTIAMTGMGAVALGAGAIRRSRKIREESLATAVRSLRRASARGK